MLIVLKITNLGGELLKIDILVTCKINLSEKREEIKVITELDNPFPVSGSHFVFYRIFSLYVSLSDAKKILFKVALDN